MSAVGKQHTKRILRKIAITAAILAPVGVGGYYLEQWIWPSAPSNPAAQPNYPVYVECATQMQTDLIAERYQLRRQAQKLCGVGGEPLIRATFEEKVCPDVGTLKNQIRAAQAALNECGPPQTPVPPVQVPSPQQNKR